MIVERQDRVPKGTFKVLAQKQGANTVYQALNLNTDRLLFGRNLWELIKGIEGDLADNKYPQCCMQYRSWGLGSPVTQPAGTKVVELEDAKQAISTPAGPTFIIRVLFRQNATWQGTIQWIEGRQTRQYRSVNELMWLMDEVLDAPPRQADEPTA